MNDEIIKRYSLAEIALLLIFVMGLVFAYLVVKVRHRITLSDPVALTGSGVSVPMPTNPGWEYEKKWRYESDNRMVLVAQQAIGRNVLVSVQWHYAICSPAGTSHEILEQIVTKSGYTIDSLQTIDKPIAMVYALVYSNDSDIPFYLGVAKLDYGRHLELQVMSYQAMDLAFAGETLFQTLVHGVQYEPPKSLAAGKQQTTDFWDALGKGQLLLSQKSDESFLIKTANQRPFGYRIDHFGNIGKSDQAKLHITSRQYEYRTSRIDSAFWFDGTQPRYNWETTVMKAGTGRPQEFTLNQGPDGNVTLTTDIGEKRQFTADGLLLPELLLPEFTAYFLEKDQDRVVVDVIANEGFVVPTIVQKMNPADGVIKTEQIAYAAKIDFLHNANAFEELYFDKNRQFIVRFDRQPLRQYIWERSSPDDLEEIFGDNFQPLSKNVALMD